MLKSGDRNGHTKSPVTETTCPGNICLGTLGREFWEVCALVPFCWNLVPQLALSYRDESLDATRKSSSHNGRHLNT